ncbi:hypothetical protein [Thermomonas sp.]|uniref:hypothetical protein n=1 Tax=Thermomonas sp. TaxID=1971895 RepID=UPI002489024C|nr:hypothetical protein [Thermomonas sp.]MDI1254125.1 hypothetical protein [Thermomonas sp.]
MLRMVFVVICLALLTACSERAVTAPVEAAVQPAATTEAPHHKPEHPSIDMPINRTPEPVRQTLLIEAINKVAREYKADWMLQPNEGSSYLIQQIESIQAQGNPDLTSYELVKQAFQNTREDFLNRAEVARTSAEILYRGQVESARNREISRTLRQQELSTQRQQAAQQALYQAELQAQAQAETSYANAASARQYAQQQYQSQVQQPSAANPSRFDPDNVGWDPRKGYTSLRSGSRKRSSNDATVRTQTGPQRFQDQYGNWYEQPPGSGFARDEKTGKQCFINGAFVQC